MYRAAWFETKEEAKDFQKKQGFGALYTNLPGSRTKRQFNDEAAMFGFDTEKYHAVVSWNE